MTSLVDVIMEFKWRVDPEGFKSVFKSQQNSLKHFLSVLRAILNPGFSSFHRTTIFFLPRRVVIHRRKPVTLVAPVHLYLANTHSQMDSP